MALTKYTCPPQKPSGFGTFSDELVGFQLVQGGGLTQGNFEFTTGISEKQNRNFETGVFSDPINLDSLNLASVVESKSIFENNFKVYPNFDLTQITNFTLYGSLTKRISVSVEQIINYFPAAIESFFYGSDYTTGTTAENVSYSISQDITTFDIKLSRISNPFGIDFTVNATRNLELLEIPVSQLRNMTVQYAKYSLYYLGQGYNVLRIIPTTSLTTGYLTITVKGNPFNNNTVIYDPFVIRPNDQEVNQVFNDALDEVERFLLNRNVTPKYTATFKVPTIDDNGGYYTSYNNVTWPILGVWNLDIVSKAFTEYLSQLNEITQNFDEYKTNLIERFLVTGSFTEFDTIGQKVKKVLQIYGRSFDETKKFIDGLAFMNSVNYNVGNDIPSKLLKNLAQTIGWTTNISPITNEELLNSVFGEKNVDQSVYSGVDTRPTPDELNYQFYRNLILNSAYLFKSKGTRKSIETLLRLIGAPDALVEFNEYVYTADERINMADFETKFATISGGTYVSNLTVLNLGDVYNIQGVTYSGYTTATTVQDVSLVRSDYPINDEGLPSTPSNSESYYFQIGSGWFEQTPQHRAPEQVDLTSSVFTGNNPSYQTILKPYTYGQDYLDRYRQFPYMDIGFTLTSQIDNNKSWYDKEIGLRENLDGNYNARYYVSDEGLVMNVKNVDLFMNPGQGLSYDVWYMSREYNFPIPNEGLFYKKPTYCDPSTTSEYPVRGGIDWTFINPKPKQETFFEFAQTFWRNMINVRNRQFATDYPTLSSIYWKYLESQTLAGISNDNFTYKTMIEYVNGLGDYWVRLVEQMIPATTIWNTGVKYENSIFHRQKFFWRRQAGCQLIPLPCKPCSLVTDILPYNCPVQSVECSIYPWSSTAAIQSFSGILGYTLTQYLTSNGYTLNDCILNSLSSTWYVDIRINDVIVVQNQFFNGVGYNNPTTSSPTNSQWLSGLTTSLNDLKNYGYDYNYQGDNVIINNVICSLNDSGTNIKINVGINFNIVCN
jgi:hypothetical protein